MQIVKVAGYSIVVPTILLIKGEPLSGNSPGLTGPIVCPSLLLIFSLIDWSKPPLLLSYSVYKRQTILLVKGESLCGKGLT